MPNLCFKPKTNFLKCRVTIKKHVRNYKKKVFSQECDPEMTVQAGLLFGLLNFSKTRISCYLLPYLIS